MVEKLTLKEFEEKLTFECKKFHDELIRDFEKKYGKELIDEYLTRLTTMATSGNIVINNTMEINRE